MTDEFWDYQHQAVKLATEKEIVPIIEGLLAQLLAKFPKAKRVAVECGMGRNWIAIDDIHFHPDRDYSVYNHGVYDAPIIYHAVGSKAFKRGGGSRYMRAWRLDHLVEFLEECDKQFLSAYNLDWPYVAVIRNEDGEIEVEA